MNYIFIVAAGIVGVLAGVVFITLIEIRRKGNTRRKKKSTPQMEFSKAVLFAVLCTYFIGVFVGIKIVFIDVTQLGVLLTYIGTPTATAIAFYSWKAKAENMIKIKKANPEATEGNNVDLNNIMP